MVQKVSYHIMKSIPRASGVRSITGRSGEVLKIVVGTPSSSGWERRSPIGVSPRQKSTSKYAARDKIMTPAVGIEKGLNETIQSRRLMNMKSKVKETEDPL